MVFIEYFFIFSVTRFIHQSIPSCDDIMIQDLSRIKLVEDIFDQCNNDIDCPIGLICEKNTCRKPGSFVRGKHYKYPIS